MVSPRELLSTIESTLLTASPPSPSQRVELLHAVRQALPSFRNLLSYPPPKQSDRAQVQSKEVRLPDSSPISLDDQDVQIALKLSDDLHLNEIDCVQLLVSVNQKSGIEGREPIEILRLAAGLWYTERRDLLMALYMLFRAVVLDQGYEADLLSSIQTHLEDLLKGGLRQRTVSLIKEINREEPTGIGGPLSERHVLDDRGALVERQAVVSSERLILVHCLVLSTLIVRTTPNDVKDIFGALKDSAAEVSHDKEASKLQTTFGLLFSLVIALVSDALSTIPDRSPVLSRDASFRKEFHEMVMSSVSDSTVEGFISCVRLAWSVHLMLNHDGTSARETSSRSSSEDLGYLNLCLELVFSKNVFQFLLNSVLRTAAYMNDDEDMVYMYNAYLHKLISCFLSHPLARDRVKEAKEKAMAGLNSYRLSAPPDLMHNDDMNSIQGAGAFPFVSLLELVSEIYQKEPELLSGNDVIWTFVNFAGEDHTNFQTLVAFLHMLSTLASSEEGARKIYELLQGKSFRSVGWSVLFDCLTMYDEKFKLSLQTPGAMLPDFPEADAKALVAYLKVLQKVVANGHPVERKNWFSDIEPLFKLLSYENVPPYVKGALRDAIATFVHVSPVLKDTIWRYLEQYDLPVVIGAHVGKIGQQTSAPVYDMQYELNEIEARQERYPSTISFLNLLNALIMEEKDLSDRGQRFVGIFRFICDHVFGPFPQRAYADPCEKWQLVVACLQHFHLMLNMYDIKDEDIDSVLDQHQLSTMARQSNLQMQLPVVDLLKDFMSGKTVFRNMMGILLAGVDSIITERTSQIHGQILEKAVQLSLDILILIFDKDVVVFDYWRPLYQPLDVILSQDHNQIVALLEYVRYGFLPQIQQSSIKIMSILSSRMVGLVQLLLKSNAANSLVEDYASCLESRSEESHIMENRMEDPGILIMQLLINNVNRPAPNIAHLLLKFDLDGPIERTILQPKFHYSCLKVILEILDKLWKPDVNALIHEFGFQLLYELCVDPVTSDPMMDLLSKKKYQFFVKHLDSIGTNPLPKRSSNQPLRISSLHQRAWLQKLLAVELHLGFSGSSSHREVHQTILTHLFGGDLFEIGCGHNLMDALTLSNSSGLGATQSIGKSKVLELLEVIQFKPPDTTIKPSQITSNVKYDSLVEDILAESASTEKGGVYCYSERGDRLIDLTSFPDKLWQKFNSVHSQLSSFDGEAELNDVREAIQKLLRWGWKYNKNLEEQAAQLHMLSGWSQIVEVSVSRRISLIENRSEVLYQTLDASLAASASPDCSLRMAFMLTQVALTCMAKLRDERFLYPTGLGSDSISSLDVMMVKQLSNGACRSVLFKLIMAILRNESSEALRRRQYALLLSYFQYCQHTLDPDIPQAVLQFLSLSDQDSEDVDLQKIDEEQAELARANFSILKKEAQAILDLVIKDATQGSEPGKAMALYVLDALISVDHERFFLSQLQSRGFLRSCLVSISNISSQDVSRDSLQEACVFEAEFALLSRISHRYGKSGTQVLFSMGALEHINSCRAVSTQGSFRRFDQKFRRDVAAAIDKQQMISTPVLRLVFSFTALVDSSDIFEVKNKIVREIIGFVKGHQLLFDQILREDVSEVDELTIEPINLAVGILSKVWPYEENDEFGFVQGLFVMMRSLFSHEPGSQKFGRSMQSSEKKRKLEPSIFRLCFSLCSYLYFLVTKKSMRLQIFEGPHEYSSPPGVQQPTLTLLSHFLSTISTYLERAAEEKSLLLNKIRDINELSRQEVDEIITVYVQKESTSASDDLQKRRYIAMVEMCQVAGNRDQLITVLLLLAEQVLNIILVHFEDGSDISDMGGLKSDSSDDVSLLCGKLLPTLERLEQLNEDKVGSNLKVFKRLVTSLKETAIQKLAH